MRLRTEQLPAAQTRAAMDSDARNVGRMNGRAANALELGMTRALPS